jgi:hypothetical protein
MLKDWKKWYQNKYSAEFVHKNGGKHIRINAVSKDNISIYQGEYDGSKMLLTQPISKYRVNIGYPTSGSITNIVPVKFFKTKTSALNFAKSYMRKH